MPTQKCSNDKTKLIAQTLFLGASVSSFTSSAGWGGQPSQLTVNLIEDEFQYSCSPDAMYDQWNNRSFDNSVLPNDYHTCVGDNCYINRYTGDQFNSTTDPVDARILKGKVYYHLDPSLGLVSQYWTKPDPGFFGYKTRIDINGNYQSDGEKQHPNYQYDVVDTPVYFKMGDFFFGGFVQSWNKNVSAGGNAYTVILNSPQALLNSCYIILDKFAGSLFGRSTGNTTNIFGSPKNYIGNLGIEYNNADIYRGAMPNVFNVYGFLESFGVDSFGAAKKTDEGISINAVLDALTVLTSVTHDSTDKLGINRRTNGNYGPKRMFSSFGSIVSKCMQQSNNPRGNTNGIYTPITDKFTDWGVINPRSLDSLGSSDSTQRCQFVLDLNELMFANVNQKIRRIPDNIRISEPIITIGELINQIAEKTGQDTFVEMIPIPYNGTLYNVIKVRCISRLKQPSTSIIESTIKQLECDRYNISSYTIGKEKNETASRAMLIGGQQQRLYQVKSYRLAYSQSNFIYDPIKKTFINYYSLADGPISSNSTPRASPGGQYGFGKIRFPNFNSTRNVNLINTAIPLSDIFDQNNAIKYADILKDEDNVQKSISKDFNTEDTKWKTNNELRDGITVNYGNYEASIKEEHVPPQEGARWFPLYMDNICPFFGFVNEDEITLQVNNSESSSDLRQIRPVWFDTWTGQLAIAIQLNELPQLNTRLDKNFLTDDNRDPFSLPQTYQISSKTTSYNNSGPVTQSTEVEFCVITESEIRAALAGFDNFLVYSLAKTYKPDLIELVRRAYYIETKKQLMTNLKLSEQRAKQIAAKETDWYWKLMGTNIGGDDLYPTIVFPDKNDGSQYIQEKALQDLKLIHKFVSDLGKYYGKKYMVKAPGLRFYRDETFTGNAFPTAVGYGYIFDGAGTFRYNYTPTNDGAWEEYGNIIDDGIAVGSTYWYSLTDDNGKIKPLLGYNNNYYYDRIRELKCKAANTATTNEMWKSDINPYFNYQAWLTLYESKTSKCDDSYIFPSLDLSNLGSTDYVTIEQKYDPAQGLKNALAGIGIGGSITQLSLNTPVNSYDAWNNLINTNSNPLPRSKLYVSTSVDEDFVYLDPINLREPRILIDAPGINLISSSEQNSQDPNKTVLSNIAIEDLMIYMKTHLYSSWDYNWIRYMLNYVSPISIEDDANPYYLGLYTISSNSSANNVELAPKAAHPFFAGIPIKSNQYVYGPWTNYPYARWNEIVPNSDYIKQTKTPKDPNNPNGEYNLTCTKQTLQINNTQAQNALDNLITSTTIEIREDLVPWNYGGMGRLDQIALKEIDSIVNYQSIIETAQLDMVGLPLFNLGNIFIIDSMDLSYIPATYDYVYKDSKDMSTVSPVNLSYIPGAVIAPAPTLTDILHTYKTLSASPAASATYVSDGPIISNIQCSVGQQGVTTTYTFRTYTRKLGLFNKEAVERTRKLALAETKRNKQISQINQELKNLTFMQRKSMLDERLNQSQFGSQDLSSKLFGWSPGMVLVGQANPLIDEPNGSPKYVEDFSLSSLPGNFNSKPGTPSIWSMTNGLDTGDTLLERSGAVQLNDSAKTLKHIGRISTTVQLYQRKEVEGQINNAYGMQSMMSLDGILSPVSFYPTYKNSTFSMSLFDSKYCPFCGGSRKRRIRVSQYDTNLRSVISIDIACDKCAPPSKKLNASIDIDDADIPINAITLNPIVVPYGEFKNSNVQNYIANGRRYIDRMRHCIEIIGRGSIPPNKAGYKLETSRNLTAYARHPDGVPKYNADYMDKDLLLEYATFNLGGSGALYENNQRFFGLRGPLILHSWGYDEEGYPVPNAADEPYEIDNYGRPKRFKLKQTVDASTVPFKSLSFGTIFSLEANSTTGLYVKSFNQGSLLPAVVLNDPNTPVYKVTIADDLSADGIFDPNQTVNNNLGLGSIISKTQKFTNGRWSEKFKLNQFYLNWAERPDLWRVGPIDLHWDSRRRVWTAGGGGAAEEQTPPYIVTNSNDIDSLDEFLNKKNNKNGPYRMIYATLEEDLIKQPDFDETFATRGFIDDVEFSKEPLLLGYRRLIYIKDKTGYSAPKGTKLLCRYNKFTGFYEPISKPNLTAKGKILNNYEALIDATYIQGRRSSTIPQLSVTYDNPLEFDIKNNNIGIFIFVNGRWTLTATK